jgi:hypothetical protein
MQRKTRPVDQYRPGPNMIDTDESSTYVEGIAPAGHVPEQLRRRRAASWRCPPLSCGHRDPLDHYNVPLGRSAADLRAARRAWGHLHAHGLAFTPIAAAIGREVTA